MINESLKLCIESIVMEGKRLGLPPINPKIPAEWWTQLIQSEATLSDRARLSSCVTELMRGLITHLSAH